MSGPGVRGGPHGVGLTFFANIYLVTKGFSYGIQTGYADTYREALKCIRSWGQGLSPEGRGRSHSFVKYC